MKLASPLPLWCQFLSIYVLCIWKIVQRTWGCGGASCIDFFNFMPPSCCHVISWIVIRGSILESLCVCCLFALYGTRMHLWPPQIHEDFVWKRMNYFSFLLKSSSSTIEVSFLSLFFLSSWLSSFEKLKWIQRKSQIWQLSRERTNNFQCQCLSISWRQGERWGVFWSEAWKGWRKGQSANVCLLFSWFT